VSPDKTPWFKPIVGDREARALEEVIETGFVNDGPMTERFERAIASLVGRKHAVAVTSGTAAITLALMAADLPPGSDVIVPDLTFVATANAVRLAGLRPVLADVSAHRFCLTVETVEEARTSYTTAVVTVEVNGRSPNYPRLTKYCDQHKLVLITDSCEALCSYDLGTHGLASCLSFSPNKIITTGQGGMVLTDSDALVAKVRELKDQGRAHRGTGGDDLHPVVGYNFKFTDLQAAVGLAQLEDIQDRVYLARKRNEVYWALLKDVAVIPPSHINELPLWFDILSPARYEIGREVNTRNFWRPLHEQGPYQTTRKFPSADHVSSLGVWLPSALDISRDEIVRVCDVVRRCHERVFVTGRVA
jgi:perosamine synthetase